MDRSKDFVALLGTKGGPAIRPGSTNPTSSLVCLDERLIVVDCGLGVSRGLVDQGMELRDLNLIFITHLHSDHYLELGPLIHTAWTAGLNSNVRVIGPDGLKDYWDAFLISMKADIELRIADEGRPDLAALVTIETLDAGAAFKEDRLTVSAIRNVHPPLIDTFALRFDTDRRSVVFSGDTAHFPPLREFSEGADLLIHEAMLKPALEALTKRIGNTDDRLMKHLLRSHTTAEHAAQIATSAGVKALALHHLIPSDDPEFTSEHWKEAVAEHWQGPFYPGGDGTRIELG